MPGNNETAQQCDLCFRRCLISSGNRGFCGVMENRDGALESSVYGMVWAHNADPVEKKPLYHFFPGSRTFSVGTPGCNMTCPFCQNRSLVRHSLQGGMELSPRGIVRQAVQKHCRSIALTYNEPTVFWPFGRDIFRAARREGLRTVMVSNGMMTEETARDMASLTDAVNIDLKAFTPAAVRFLGGGLPTVLQNLSVFMSAGVHVEVTTLAVPGLSDSPEELHEHLPLFRQYIPHSVPWHLSRFFPAGDWCNSAPTDTEVLHAMRRVLLQDGYQYVYRGNVAETEDTLCPRCGSHVIDRSSGAVFLPDGVCQQCGNSITGRFS